MTVSIEESEIRNQPHEMWAEGTSSEEPILAHIDTLLEKEGYITSNVAIWFDGMQGFYRWHCDIKNINPRPPGKV